MPSPTPFKKSSKIFQVAIYLCKAAASRLFSSTLLFGPGSVEMCFPFSQWGSRCLWCALPTSLGCWGPWLESLSRVTEERGEAIILPLAAQHLPGKLLCTEMKPLAGPLDLVFQNRLEYIECTSLGSKQQGWECCLQQAGWSMKMIPLSKFIMPGIYLKKSQHLWVIKISDIFIFIKRRATWQIFWGPTLWMGYATYNDKYNV